MSEEEKGREKRGKKEGQKKPLFLLGCRSRNHGVHHGTISLRIDSQKLEVPHPMNDANDFPVILGIAAVFTYCPKQE